MIEPEVPLVGIDDVRAAAARVYAVARRTAVSAPTAVARIVGADVVLKEEQRQRTGSFKIRGAYNRMAALDHGTPVVAASAGNHAQGVALAAARLGLPATIFMPSSASLPKVNATEDYGATVRFAGVSVDDAVVAARAYADEHGATFVPPFDDPLVIAGQGTLGLELADDVPDATTVVVPVGGGGLISGVAVALKAVRPGVRVVGVEAAGAASMAASVAAGAPRTLRSLATIADGIAVKSPSARTLAHVEALVDGLVTVADEAIAEAMLVLLERAKIVVEPSGAASLAAVMSGAVPRSGRVVCGLSGGNVDPLLLSRLVEHGLSAAGRYLRLRIAIPDRPCWPSSGSTCSTSSTTARACPASTWATSSCRSWSRRAAPRTATSAWPPCASAAGTSSSTDARRPHEAGARSIATRPTRRPRPRPSRARGWG